MSYKRSEGSQEAKHYKKASHTEALEANIGLLDM